MSFKLSTKQVDNVLLIASQHHDAAKEATELLQLGYPGLPQHETILTALKALQESCVLLAAAVRKKREG